IRPKPSTPSVFSYTSTPLNFDRSHAPAVSEPWACGTLRASASSIASVCSAAVITFDCGAFATTTPRFVAASTSTLSTPTPAPGAARELSPGLADLLLDEDLHVRRPSGPAGRLRGGPAGRPPRPCPARPRGPAGAGSSRRRPW